MLFDSLLECHADYNPFTLPRGKSSLHLKKGGGCFSACDPSTQEVGQEDQVFKVIFNYKASLGYPGLQETLSQRNKTKQKIVRKQ